MPRTAPALAPGFVIRRAIGIRPAGRVDRAGRPEENQLTSAAFATSGFSWAA